MMTRFLYVIVVLLVLAVGWQGLTFRQTWHYLDRESNAQSYGADPDKAVVTINAFVNYTHRPTKNINADVMDVVSRNPDTRIIFHVIPAGSLLAFKSAQIAMAAAQQDKFVAMHEELMRNEKPLIDDNIRAMAEKIKADPDKLLADMKSEAVKESLRKEVDAAKKLKIYGSPLFVINRKWLYGPDSEQAVSGDLTNLINQAKAH